YASLSREGLAPRTTRMVHTALHRALGQAKNWGILRDNPADIAKPPKAPSNETPMLQPDQAAILLERLPGKQLYLIASLALGTGMRRNEMLGLTLGGRRSGRRPAHNRAIIGADGRPWDQGQGPQNAAWASDDLAARASCG